MAVMRALAMVMVLGLVMVSQAGCLAVAAAGAAGAGVLYTKGDLDANLEAPPPRVIEATKMAMKELQYVVVSANSSATDGEVVARTGTDRKVKVDVKQVGDTSSKVSIRVGTFGDEEMSVRVLEKIKSHLATPVP